jgi:archaeal preflagellin peptidase FlaK
MIQGFFFIVTFTALLLSAYTDIQKRIVPPLITHTMIFGGLFLQTIYVFVFNDYSLFFPALITVTVTFAVSYFLWKTGFWAGGDVKLFTGIAVLNPFNYAIIGTFLFGNNSLIAPISSPVFPFTLFLFSLFAVFPIGAAMAMKTVAKNRQIQKEIGAESKKIFINIVRIAFVLIAAGYVLGLAGLPQLLVLLIVVALAFQKEIVKNAFFFISLIVSFYAHHTNALIIAVGIIVPLFVFYFLIRFFLISRKHTFSFEKKITHLKEGEIPQETIFEKNGEIIRVQPSIVTIINYLKSNRLGLLSEIIFPKEKIFANALSAAGVTEEQLKMLRKAVEEKKIEDKIMVKKSVPFVPAVLVAYIALQIMGDFFWNVVL